MRLAGALVPNPGTSSKGGVTGWIVSSDKVNDSLRPGLVIRSERFYAAPPMNPIVQEIIQGLRKSGLRRTKALEELITTLLESKRPMTLVELATSERLADQCDKATVFRLLQRLAEHGAVRRLGLHERAAYFTLLIPGKHSDYLICTSCGSIEAINAPCPVHQLEAEIREKTGYRNLYHELEFFGVCPKCA
jgi:Fe2+ or Zn2+ uptake regulation protein